MEQISKSVFHTVESESPVTEIKIKGSRFISQVWHIESVEEFNLLYQQVKKKYVNASHYCYAYRISTDLYHYYDDGEPSGTAGKPIFHILSEQNLIEVLIMVVRYFGGTRLGRGGLVKAYIQSAQEALKGIRIGPKIFFRTFRFRSSYLVIQELMNLIKNYEGIIEQSEYTDQIKMTVRIAENRYPEFQNELSILVNKKQLVVELSGSAT